MEQIRCGDQKKGFGSYKPLPGSEGMHSAQPGESSGPHVTAWSWKILCAGDSVGAGGVSCGKWCQKLHATLVCWTHVSSKCSSCSLKSGNASVGTVFVQKPRVGHGKFLAEIPFASRLFARSWCWAKFLGAEKGIQQAEWVKLRSSVVLAVVSGRFLSPGAGAASPGGEWCWCAAVCLPISLQHCPSLPFPVIMLNELPAWTAARCQHMAEGFNSAFRN